VSSIDITELHDEHEAKRDFRRANGAPLVSDPTDPTKTLRYSRPSSYAKCLDDEMALTDWRIWKAMEGVARSPALQTQVIATRDDDRVEKKDLREKALDKGTANERADQGTGLHAMTVRIEDPTDVDFDPGEPFATDLAAYTTMLDAYGLVSELIEVPFVNDRFRSAGTADRVYRVTKMLEAPNGTLIEPGTLVVGDLKTGAKLDFSLPGFCVQTALYATGQLYDVVDERRLPTPPIDQRWALIAHLPVGMGRCDLLWSPIDIGLIGAQLAQATKEWRKLWKNGTYDATPVEVPKEASELLAEITVEAGPVIALDVMAKYCQARINSIGGYPDAKAKLILLWPEGLPTPKKGVETPEQMVTLLNLLDKVEAEFSIPFSVSDPRYEGMKGHRNEIDRSNEFMLTS